MSPTPKGIVHAGLESSRTLGTLGTWGMPRSSGLGCGLLRFRSAKTSGGAPSWDPPPLVNPRKRRHKSIRRSSCAAFFSCRRDAGNLQIGQVLEWRRARSAQAPHAACEHGNARGEVMTSKQIQQVIARSTASATPSSSQTRDCRDILKREEAPKSAGDVRKKSAGKTAHPQ
eukprot:scaffold859_cov306-Pinguiococcus_pyrenoidosus.AAC.9